MNTTHHHNNPLCTSPFTWNFGYDEPEPLPVETEVRVSKAIIWLIEQRGAVSRQEIATELEKFGAGTLLLVLDAMHRMERIEVDPEGLIRMRPLRIRDRNRPAA